MNRSWLTLCSLVVLCGAACRATPPPRPMPVCQVTVAASPSPEAMRELPASVWSEFLIRDFDRAAGGWRGSLRDCSGVPVSPQPCSAEISEALPPRRLSESDVIIAPVDEKHLAIWVQAQRYRNGEAAGPVALVEIGARSLSVRALGMLRSAATKPSLRVQPTSAGAVLVAEGQRCAGESKACSKVVTLMPRVGHRFVEMPLHDETGRCLGPMQFELYAQEEVDIGVRRRFELIRSLRFESNPPTVDEQVTVEDIDPADPDAAPTIFRRASVSRSLEIRGDRAIVEAGVWQTIRAELGTLALRGEESIRATGT